MNELTLANERMKIQLVEKEKSLVALQRSVTTLEQQVVADQSENETSRHLREETEGLHTALRLVDSH